MVYERREDRPKQPDPADDFEAWARLSAKLFRRSAADRVRLVHDAGLERRWHDIDARWFDALREDLAQGDLERIDRLVELCQQERANQTLRSPLDEAFPEPVASKDESITPPWAREVDSPTTDAGSSPPPPPPHADAAVPVAPTEVHEDDLRAAVEAGERAARWSVDKYAWLCAELDAAPNRRAQVCREHDLRGETAVEAVHAAWELAFERDPARERRFRQLYDRFAEAIARGDHSERPRS